jgi:hypothetical protein
MSDPSQTPVPPQMPPKKKGLHPLAWVGIGCGGVALLGVIVVGLLVWTGVKQAKGLMDEIAKEMKENPAKDSAELIVEANPDIEKVSQYDDTGEMTVRIRSTGEEITFQFQDLAKGPGELKDTNGNVIGPVQGDLTQVPSWVPRYPGLENETVSYQIEENGGKTGLISGKTNHPLKAIKVFYDGVIPEKLSSRSSSQSGVGSEGKLSLSYAGEAKNLTIEAYENAGETYLHTRYEE